MLGNFFLKQSKMFKLLRIWYKYIKKYQRKVEFDKFQEVYGIDDGKKNEDNTFTWTHLSQLDNSNSQDGSDLESNGMTRSIVSQLEQGDLLNMDNKEREKLFQNLEKMDDIDEEMGVEESIKLIKIEFYMNEFFIYLVDILQSRAFYFLQ